MRLTMYCHNPSCKLVNVEQIRDYAPTSRHGPGEWIDEPECGACPAPLHEHKSDDVIDFVDKLSRASQCYAVDSGGDWAYAGGHVRDAAQIAVDANWTPEQVEAAHKLKQQLVRLDEVQRAVSRLRQVAA